MPVRLHSLCLTETGVIHELFQLALVESGFKLSRRMLGRILDFALVLDRVAAPPFRKNGCLI